MVIKIPARKLDITDGDNPACWEWNTLPSPPGEEVATLKSDTVLKIGGKIPRSQLKENSSYTAYFVFKVDISYNGIDEAYAAAGSRRQNLISLARSPSVRPDLWFQVELGTFDINSEGDENVLISLAGIDEKTQKSGLIVRAIEICPAK